MPMVIKLDESKRAKCRISEMPGEEKFDLEINMQLNQTAMNQIVEIKQFGPSKENHILNIDAILCDKGDLENEAEKSNGWTGSSIMRNWKAGMMQRRWRDSEDQLTRV